MYISSLTSVDYSISASMNSRYGERGIITNNRLFNRNQSKRLVD